MIFWTCATWILTPIAISHFGFNGVSMASAFISLSTVAVIFIVKKYIKFNVFRVVSYPLLATLIMGIVLYFTASFVITDFLTLIVMIVGGAILYFVTMLLLAKKQIIADVRLIKENLSK